MSPVALTLNLALGALLIGAMILGLRLERRLKALREGHLGFAKAVSELDQASRRTEASLAELKDTAEDTRLVLASRIDTARVLSERLTGLIAEAETKLEALAKQPAAPARPMLLRQVERTEGMGMRTMASAAADSTLSSASRST